MWPETDRDGEEIRITIEEMEMKYRNKNTTINHGRRMTRVQTNAGTVMGTGVDG